MVGCGGGRHPPWNKKTCPPSSLPNTLGTVAALSGKSVRLEIAAKTRDLALFNLAIDSKLRGCDLVRLNVTDFLAAGAIREPVSIIQRKTCQPVLFEITDGIRASRERAFAAAAFAICLRA